MSKLRKVFDSQFIESEAPRPNDVIIERVYLKNLKKYTNLSYF